MGAIYRDKCGRGYLEGHRLWQAEIAGDVSWHWKVELKTGHSAPKSQRVTGHSREVLAMKREEGGILRELQGGVFLHFNIEGT